MLRAMRMGVGLGTRDVEKEYRGKSAVHRKSLFLGKAHGFFDSECELLLHDCDVVIGR